MTSKCATVGCRARSEGEVEWFCTPCGESYARRPALRGRFIPDTERGAHLDEISARTEALATLQSLAEVK